MTDPHRQNPAQSADALHFQPEWCRVTLASIGDAVITTDTEGQVTFLNSVAESLTGWTLAEAVGQSLDVVFRIVNEDSRQTVESPTTRALREGVVVGLANHTLLIAKDGIERPIDDSAAPIRNDQGEIAGVVLVFRDISERKQAEAARERLAAIVESSNDGIISKDLNGIITSWNGGAERLFGYTAQEAIGLPATILIPPDHVDEEPNILKRIRRGETIDHIETVRRHKDGRLLDISLTVSPVSDAHGRIVGASKIARDITERKRLEERLKISEMRFRRLFEAAQDGILILDAEKGRITDANLFMINLLGYPREKLLHKEMWEIGLVKDKAESQTAVRTLQTDGYLRYDHSLETADGRRVDVEVVANVYQEDHRPVIQCNIRDITERNRLEKMSKEQAAALSDLHRRKDEFLAMLSHELRNPLAPIANAVHLLRLQKNEDKLQQQARNIIERQLGQMTRLIDELLEVSRITTGRIHLHQEHLDLRSIVQRAVETAGPLMVQHAQVLTTRLPPEPVWVHADATRLEQVMVNLLHNAAKYSHDHGHIWLGLEQEGAEAVLRVHDAGIGIAPDILPRIFDLFTQSERSLDRSQDGLGIGLALVRELVTMHGGTVEASSTLGHGSKFIVRLPVVPISAPNVSVALTETASPTGRSSRMLVVDDNVDAAESLSLLLQQAGHEARLVHDGLSALQAALDYQPEVVLLDIGLPGLNGYEVAKRIRKEPTLQNVVLVALTGYGQETDRQASVAAGFNHHLVKPVPFKNLQQILEAISRKPT